MTVVRVWRKQGQDRHGDSQFVFSHEEVGARVAWASPTIDWDHKTVVMSSPTLYFKNTRPNIIAGDKLEVLDRTLLVTSVAPWEHPRRENTMAGVAITCQAVR